MYYVECVGFLSDRVNVLPEIRGYANPAPNHNNPSDSTGRMSPTPAA